MRGSAVIIFGALLATVAVVYGAQQPQASHPELIPMQDGPGPAVCTPPPVSLGITTVGPTEFAAANWKNGSWLQWNFTAVAPNTCVQIIASFETGIPGPNPGPKKDVNLWTCTSQGCPADQCTISNEADAIVGPPPLAPGQVQTTFPVSAGPAYVGIKPLSDYYSEFNVSLQMEQIVCGNPAGCYPKPIPVDIPTIGQGATTVALKPSNNTWTVYQYNAVDGYGCITADALYTGPTKLNNTGYEQAEIWICATNACPSTACLSIDDSDMKISAKAPNAAASTPVAVNKGTAYFGVFMSSNALEQVPFNLTLTQQACPSTFPTSPTPALSPGQSPNPTGSSSPVPVVPGDPCTAEKNKDSCYNLGDDCYWCTPVNECVNATAANHIGTGDTTCLREAPAKKKKCGGGCAAGVIFGLLAVGGIAGGGFYIYRKKKHGFEMKNFESGHSSTSGAYSTFN